MTDYTSPGEDFLGALQTELAEFNDGDTEAEEAKRAVAQCVPWRVVSPRARAIFSAAAARFLAE